MKNYLIITFILVAVFFSILNCSCTIKDGPIVEPYQLYLDSISSCRFSIYKYQDSIAITNSEKQSIEKKHANILELKKNRPQKKPEKITIVNKDTSIVLNKDSISKAERARFIEDSINVRKKDSLIQVEIDKDALNYKNDIGRCNAKLEKFRKEKDSYEKRLNGYIASLRKEMKSSNGAFVFRYMGVKYKMFIHDLNNDSFKVSVDLYDLNGNHFNNFNNYKKHLTKLKFDPLMITNGGMFSPNQDPQGLFVNKSRNLCFEPDTTHPLTDGNFYLMPNGIFYIDTLNQANIVSTDDFVKNGLDINSFQFASQSGPMLLRNGLKNSNLKDRSPNKKIRSGVGVVGKNKLIFICSDGPENFWLFTQLFEDLFEIKNVLFLDGAISKMYLKGKDESDLGGYFGPMISISKIK